MANVTVSFQTDEVLKARFEAALSGLGLTLDDAINHYMKELVQDWEVPTSPYLSTPETLAEDLSRAEEARRNGYRGRTGREVLAEMDRIIAAAEARGQ